MPFRCMLSRDEQCTALVGLMSEHYSIQEVGGTELVDQFPDCGLIPEANWHKAILTAGKEAHGWQRLFRKTERFISILSANDAGLRLVVTLDDFATFIPWSELNVTAERSMPGTAVCVRTAKVPLLLLEFHLDDTAADELFTSRIPPLPQRDPPGRIYWPKPWAVGLLITVMLAASFVLVWLHLSNVPLLIAGTATAIIIWLAWITWRPVFEEKR
jgi:hypothetical protein